MSLFEDIKKGLEEIIKAPEKPLVSLPSCKNCFYLKNKGKSISGNFCLKRNKKLEYDRAKICGFFTVEAPSISMPQVETESDIPLKKETLGLDKSLSPVRVSDVDSVTSMDLMALLQKIVEVGVVKKVEVIEGSVDPYSLTSKIKGLDKLELAYDESGNISTVKGFEGADQQYLLTFTWVEGALTEIVRT